MRSALVALFLLGALPAAADTAEAISDHVLPGYAEFARASTDLAGAAAQDCSAAPLKEPWNRAFDAWTGVAHLRLGPAEDGGRALAIAFWPDPKATGARQTAAMIAAADPALATPEGLAGASVAARGFYALERLLWGAPYGPGDYSCALVRGLAGDLAGLAEALAQDWGQPGSGGYADQLLSPGAEGNTRFLTPDESRQALFTQLITGLEFNADQRLGRPLGSFDKPRPERAEAIASGRSLRNVTLSVIALRDLARSLAGEHPATEAAFARAIALAQDLDDPVFAGVAEPASRLKVEILQQAIRAAQEAALAEVGGALGVGVGFNSADGD